MSDLYQEITEFSGGVQSAAAPDRIPPNSTPLAINTAFKNIGSGQANIGTRPGLETVNTTAISGSPAFLFQDVYSYDTGSGFSNYLVYVAVDGTLRFKDDDNNVGSALAVPANFPNPSTLCFSAGTALVDSTVMNNRLFLVNASLERRSLLGTSYKAWGLTAIAATTIASAAGGTNSMPNETYNVAVTAYDNATGAESSIGAITSVSMGGASRRIKVDISPTSAETAQYPYWRIYLQRTTTQADLYLVQKLYNLAASVIVTNADIPIGTTTAYVDISAADIANLIVVAPRPEDNGVPPSDIKYVATYGRRLLAASDRNIYWSQLDKPDNFSDRAYEPVDTGEGDRITGIFPFSDELLMIFTSQNVWGLFGSDPTSWTLRPIDHTVGCCSHLSIVEFEGKIGWWSINEGPVWYDGEQIHHQALDDLGWQAVVADIESSRLDFVYGGYDPQGQRVLWSVGSSGSANRNNRLIPYNTRLRRFEASYWNPMDFATIGSGFTSDGTLRLFAGNYGGQIFYFDVDTTKDGIPGGTLITTFMPVASSVSTITSSGFYNTGSGLAERYVLVTDEENRPVAKVRIASNTATVLTLATNVAGLSVGRTYNAYLGSPDLRLYTKWLDLGETFNRKRWDRLYVQAQSNSDASGLYATTQINFSETAQKVQNPFNIDAAKWDQGTWDSSQWAGVGQLKKRLFIGRTGQAIRVAIFHFNTNQDLTIHTIALLARLQSDRYYA